MEVGFPFKGNFTVAFDHPFNDIPQVKGDDQHFFLLLPMNLFMVDQSPVCEPARLNEDSQGRERDS